MMDDGTDTLKNDGLIRVTSRGEFWPGKNHKYFKTRKLFMEYFVPIF